MKKIGNCKRFALIGLDGSGKSTYINKMKQDSQCNGYEFIWVRWNPFLLKPLYMLLETKLKNQKTTETKMQYGAKKKLKQKIFKNPIIRGGWMTIAFFDYFIQFYLKTCKFILLKENIIFDRYYIDFFVDQGISLGYTAEKIKSIVCKFQKFFPKIDKIIYIQVSPDVCLQRKNDIPSMDYLLNRFEIYELLSENNLWVCIDGEKTLEEVFSSIKTLIQ